MDFVKIDKQDVYNYDTGKYLSNGWIFVLATVNASYGKFIVLCADGRIYFIQDYWSLMKKMLRA